MDGADGHRGGGQAKYSDLAITLCLTLRVVYGLALRQTQGFDAQCRGADGVRYAVPDFPPCLAGAKGWRCRRQSPEPHIRSGPSGCRQHRL
ncbi:transposase [Rhizobium beringeri]|uniref:transposase n=1 Tax=Rhizobium beringeri TaxID=3019934 RepID=UPI003B595AB0